MTLKLVESIKETERQAEILIREAQQKARQLLREAENRAGQLLQENKAAAAESAKEIMARAEIEARQETAVLAAAHQKEITAIKEKAGGRLPGVVTMIAEKVVKTHAHS